MAVRPRVQRLAPALSFVAACTVGLIGGMVLLDAQVGVESGAATNAGAGHGGCTGCGDKATMAAFAKQQHQAAGGTSGGPAGGGSEARP
ncbi:MAG: hypothetical protein IOD15_07190 [Phycisphaerales bacterium]|jgi:hypothetical protein|nr:hypothetical protein [Phycisphaerales bacterium]